MLQHQPSSQARYPGQCHPLLDIIDIYIYRVSGLSCPEAGGCKSAILRGFLDVFSLFGPCMVGASSFRYSLTIGMKKLFRNPNLKKGQISGLAQIDIFLISNFFDYLSMFIHVVQEY